jgi:hypothetical protein
MSPRFARACVVGLAAFVPALAAADAYVVTRPSPVVIVPTQPLVQPPPPQIVVQPGNVVTAPAPVYVVQPDTPVVTGSPPVILVAPDAAPSDTGVVYYRTLPVPQDYSDERAQCESLRGLDRDRCTNDVNRLTSGVDAKCQKLSGFELQNCILGADHGQ